MGVDLIIGHHPHVVQDFEMFKGVPIFYSLGNAVFDQDWAVNTRIGIAPIISTKYNEFLSKHEITKITVVSIKIGDLYTHFKPEFKKLDVDFSESFHFVDEKKIS
jgi:poly-gamma-glutamate capsule biosynthesis protein CapA/YwtB (metallophosphatase superfamily)